LDELERRRQAQQQRLTARHQVAADVIAGRLSLLEAAARFRDLNAQEPAIAAAFTRSHPDRSPEECLCRQVIGQVESDLAEQSPKRAAELRTRLEAELRGHLHRDGAIRLPD